MAGVRDRQPRVTTPGIALRRHPVGLLFTSWPWRCLAYVLSTPLIAAVWLVSCWPLLPLAGVPLGRLERHRLTARSRTDPEPARPGPSGRAGGVDPCAGTRADQLD